MLQCSHEYSPEERNIIRVPIVHLQPNWIFLFVIFSNNWNHRSAEFINYKNAHSVLQWNTWAVGIVQLTHQRFALGAIIPGPKVKGFLPLPLTECWVNWAILFKWAIFFKFSYISKLLMLTLSINASPFEVLPLCFHKSHYLIDY